MPPSCYRAIAKGVKQLLLLFVVWHSSVQSRVAYLRVSTLDQNIDKNKADILQFANKHDLGKVNFVEEIASGRTPWRQRGIATVLEDLQENDTIIVSELSRLGRSMLECMEILALAVRKGIRIYAVQVFLPSIMCIMLRTFGAVVANQRAIPVLMTGELESAFVPLLPTCPR